VRKTMNEEITKESFDFAGFHADLFFHEGARICAIILNGSMETQPVLELREKIREHTMIKRYNFIVDLSRVTYISSTALALLMFLAGRKNEFIYLSSPRKDIARPIKILGIHDMFSFYDHIEDLFEAASIPDEMVEFMKHQLEPKVEETIHNRWLKILRDYLSYVKIVELVDSMKPYIEQADTGKSIAIPSDEMYTCILYKFLERIIRKVAKFDPGEISDATIEMISKELMANSVRHGYNYQKEGLVEAYYGIDAEKFEIRIIDYGKGFTPSQGKTYPSVGLRLLEKIFDRMTVSDAPQKETTSLVLGKGTQISLIKYLIPKV
jgi:anti-anti-sigma factor